MSGTDHVSLFADSTLSRRTHQVPYPDQWPPPEHLILLRSAALGEDLGVVTVDWVKALVEEASGSTRLLPYTLIPYRRLIYSWEPHGVSQDQPSLGAIRDAAYIPEHCAPERRGHARVRQGLPRRPVHR